MANYDPNIGHILMWLPIIILGIMAYRKREREVREGKRKGIPQSKGLFDWMFYFHNRD